MSLTKAQEIFVNELVKGKTQREAYMIAYPNSRKWKENSVDSRASTLLKSAKVMQRYNELQKVVSESLKQDTIASKQEVLEFFTKMMRRELEEETIITDTIKESKLDEDGFRVITQTRIPKIVKTVTKNTDAYKGAEALAKHYGALMPQGVDDNELSKVDELLKAMEIGVKDD